MRLLQYGGASGIRTHEDLRPTAFRERHFRPLRHLSVGEYSISVGGLASPLIPTQSFSKVAVRPSRVPSKTFCCGACGLRPQAPQQKISGGCKPPIFLL